MKAAWAAIGYICLAILVILATEEARAGQLYYYSDKSHPLTMRWYLIEEPCRDTRALAFVPPGLRARVQHGNVVIPNWIPGSFSFCWIVTSKKELLRFWPTGRIDLDSIHYYQPDKGI